MHAVNVLLVAENTIKAQAFANKTGSDIHVKTANSSKKSIIKARWKSRNA